MNILILHPWCQFSNCLFYAQSENFIWAILGENLENMCLNSQAHFIWSLPTYWHLSSAKWSNSLNTLKLRSLIWVLYSCSFNGSENHQGLSCHQSLLFLTLQKSPLPTSFLLTHWEPNVIAKRIFLASALKMENVKSFVKFRFQGKFRHTATTPSDC